MYLFPFFFSSFLSSNVHAKEDNTERTIGNVSLSSSPAPSTYVSVFVYAILQLHAKTGNTLLHCVFGIKTFIPKNTCNDLRKCSNAIRRNIRHELNAVNTWMSRLVEYNRLSRNFYDVCEEHTHSHRMSRNFYIWKLGKETMTVEFLSMIKFRVMNLPSRVVACTCISTLVYSAECCVRLIGKNLRGWMQNIHIYIHEYRSEPGLKSMDQFRRGHEVA